MHPVRIRSGEGNAMDQRALEWDNRCQCGLNLADDAHSPDCSQVIIKEPVYALIRRMHGYTNRDGRPIENQWVLGGWVKPPTPEAWNVQFGTLLDYHEYANGAYEPVTLGTVIACIRKPFEAPTPDTTWFFIRKFRERESISLDYIMNKAAAQEEARRKQARALVKAKFIDRVSTMGGAKIIGRPGQVVFQSGGPRFDYEPTPAEERLLIKESRSARAGASTETGTGTGD
jgi:hypothetical protein